MVDNIQHKTEYQKLEELQAGDELTQEQKACLGSMLGAFIGDSIGSLHQSKRNDCLDRDIENAMQMPGGGEQDVAPGQVTGDSEMAMCQLRALLAGNGKFDPFHLALYYGNWLHSEPFDLEQIVEEGLSPLLELTRPDPIASKRAVRMGRGGKSMSNKCLMRLTPLAVWARNLSTDELESCTAGDASFTHDAYDAQIACAAYCLVIKTLLKNQDDDNRAELAL